MRAAGMAKVDHAVEILRVAAAVGNALEVDKEAQRPILLKIAAACGVEERGLDLASAR